MLLTLAACGGKPAAEPTPTPETAETPEPVGTEEPDDPGETPAEGDLHDPYYWAERFGGNVCPFTVTKGETEGTYYFRDGGYFTLWLNSEMNTERWYYYNDRVITRDGKWATDPDFDDSFSSWCSYEMKPYSGPTLSEAEQDARKNGTIYSVNSWTPLMFDSWRGLFLEGAELPVEEKDFARTGLRADFADQEWIDVYLNGRSSEEAELLPGHAKLLVFPQGSIPEDRDRITEEDELRALTAADYLVKEDPDSADEDQPIFTFCIPNEYDGAAFAGGADLIFTYDGIIAYRMTVTTHEAGWKP